MPRKKTGEQTNTRSRGTMSRTMQPLRKRANRVYQRTERVVDRAEDRVKHYIRRYPERAALIAAGVGAALATGVGAALRRNNHRR